MSKKTKLILMRHGQSMWNAKNIFTGWVDVPLSEKGVSEAIEGGKKIKDIPIDIIYVSSLIRSQMTAFLAMLNHSSKKVPVIMHQGEGKIAKWSKINDENTKKNTIPVYEAWEINERMYGNLQGLNKDETREKYGKEQVHIWRRSFDICPPDGESLEVNAKRTLPYFKDEIMSKLKEQKNVFVSAHGNSLRSIIMHLDKLSNEEVLKLEIPTGEPIIYNFEDGNWEKE
jgi:2,3-bisphosphoglycerate-dependent phosphoglycerate mutase